MDQFHQIKDLDLDLFVLFGADPLFTRPIGTKAPPAPPGCKELEALLRNELNAFHNKPITEKRTAKSSASNNNSNVGNEHIKTPSMNKIDTFIDLCRDFDAIMAAFGLYMEKSSRIYSTALSAGTLDVNSFKIKNLMEKNAIVCHSASRAAEAVAKACLLSGIKSDNIGSATSASFNESRETETVSIVDSMNPSAFSNDDVDVEDHDDNDDNENEDNDNDMLTENRNLHTMPI